MVLRQCLIEPQQYARTVKDIGFFQTISAMVTPLPHKRPILMVPVSQLSLYFLTARWERLCYSVPVKHGGEILLVEVIEIGSKMCTTLFVYFFSVSDEQSGDEEVEYISSEEESWKKRPALGKNRCFLISAYFFMHWELGPFLVVTEFTGN